MIDHTNLERQKFSVKSSKKLLLDGEFNIAELKKELDAMEKQAKKEGLTNFTIMFDSTGTDSEGYSDGSVYMVLYGERLETEEEWFRRVEDMKRANERELQRAKDVVQAESLYTERIRKCNEALEKSTLRCEKCGKPNCSFCIPAGAIKSKRICHKCCEEISEKYYKGLK